MVSAFQTKTNSLLAFLKNESSAGKSVARSLFDDIDAAHSSDRQRALLPGIVLLVIAYFKDSVDDFFQVVEVCKGKRQC